MNGFKKVLCCFALFAFSTVNQADAHGPYGFTARGYGFGLNHHSFRPSIYNPGWSSYSRASFYSSYGYGGLGYGSCWPRASYHVSYRTYTPVYYTNSWPNYYSSYYVPSCYNSYYAPTYYAPVSTFYTPYVAPVIYSNVYSGFPSCAVTPTVNSLPVAAYSVKKPVTSAAPFRLASQPVQQSSALQLTQPQPQPPAGRYVLAQSANQSSSLSASVSSAALDTAPEELVAAADAILAAGGYRQAAQAYAQLVVKYGNSDRLVTRRFIAQVANGDFDQASVVIELAIANGNRLDRSDLPQGDLKVALGDSAGLVASRVESLAANALQSSEDAVPMLSVAHWLALSGDDQRAELFKARASQMQQTEAGLLVHTPIVSSSKAQ